MHSEKKTLTSLRTHQPQRGHTILWQTNCFANIFFSIITNTTKDKNFNNSETFAFITLLMYRILV